MRVSCCFLLCCVRVKVAGCVVGGVVLQWSRGPWLSAQVRSAPQAAAPGLMMGCVRLYLSYVELLVWCFLGDYDLTQVHSAPQAAAPESNGVVVVWCG